MTKTEKKAVDKWLNYLEYNMMKEMINIQDRCALTPSGSNRIERNQMRIILNFIDYQRVILKEQ